MTETRRTFLFRSTLGTSTRLGTWRAPSAKPKCRSRGSLTACSETHRLNAPRITVVGSYATGLTMKVERLPSRGETLLGTGYRVDFGGKGSNQAVACARLGATVSFVAKIGKDNFGDAALRLFQDEGVDVTHVSQVPEAPTGVGFIVVEAGSGNNCIVIDPGANDLLTAKNVSDSVAA